jgi:hypothetical protein
VGRQQRLRTMGNGDRTHNHSQLMRINLDDETETYSLTQE